MAIQPITFTPSISPPTQGQPLNNGGIHPITFTPGQNQQNKPTAVTTPVSVSKPISIQPKQPGLIQQTENLFSNLIKGLTVHLVPPTTVTKPPPTPKALVTPQFSPTQQKQIAQLKVGQVIPNFESPQAGQSAQMNVTPSSLKSQKKTNDTITKVTNNIGNFVNSVKDQYSEGMKELSKGVVPNMNQVMPRQEYTSEAQYQQAVKTSKQEAKGNYSTPAQINRLLSIAILKPIETTSFGLIKGNIQPKNNLEKISSTIAQFAPLAAVPVKTLVKFTAISMGFDTALQKATGKQSVSELLPSNTPDAAKFGVDMLEFLGKAYLAHSINIGKLTDVFTKNTLETHGLPQIYQFSPQQVQDVVIGKNQGFAKDILSKLGMTSDQWREAAKSGAKIDIPATKIVTMTDKPYWAKIKSLFNISPTEKTTVSGGEGKITNVAGLLKSGENTPQDILNTVIGNKLEETPEGKAAIKIAMQAQNKGMNIAIAKEGENAVSETNVSPRPSEEAKSTSLVTPETEKNALTYVKENPEKVIQDYNSSVEKRYGTQNIVSADEAKPILPGYAGHLAKSYHPASAKVRDLVYDSKLSENKGQGNNTVLFTAGGTGVGKTTAIRNVGKDLKDYPIVYDSNLTGEKSIGVVQKALDNGYKVDITFVHRGAVESFEHGVLPRVNKENRVVPISEHVKRHMAALNDILRLKEHFGDKIKVEAIDNTGKLEDAKIVPLENLEKMDYHKDVLTQLLNEKTNEALTRNEITREQADAITERDFSANPSEGTQNRVSETKSTSTLTPESFKDTELSQLIGIHGSTLSNITNILKEGFKTTEFSKTVFFSADKDDFRAKTYNRGAEIKLNLSSLKLLDLESYEGKQLVKREGYNSYFPSKGFIEHLMVNKYDGIIDHGLNESRDIQVFNIDKLNKLVQEQYSSVKNFNPEAGYIDPGAIVKDIQEMMVKAKQNKEDKEFGTALRTYFVGERDTRIAETNQLVLAGERLVKKPLEQDALTIMRDFAKRPGDLQMILAGTHEYYDKAVERFKKENPDASEEDIQKFADELLKRGQNLRKVIETAQNPTAGMKKVNDAMTVYFKQRLEEGQKLGFLDSKISPEEYITHLLIPADEGEKPAKGMFTKKNKIGRYFQFAKGRAYKDVVEAYLNGIDPRTLNAFHALSIYGDKHATVAATKLLIQQLKDTELGKWGSRKSEFIPKDWMPIAPESNLFKNEIPFVTQAPMEGLSEQDTAKWEKLVKDGQAKIIGDNYVKADIAHQSLFAPKKVVDALKPITDGDYMNTLPLFGKSRLYQQYIKSVELSLSVFHMRALNITSLSNQGIVDLMKTYLNDMKSEKFLEQERNFIKAGGTTSVLGRTIEAYRGTRETSIPGKIKIPTTSEILKMLPGVKQLEAGAQFLTHETFDVMQRKMKVTDFALKDAKWIAKHPKADEITHYNAQKQIAKEINAAYGGLQWEILGVNKMTQSMLKFLLLAPDWTFSNWFNVATAFKGGAGGMAARAFWLRAIIIGIVLNQTWSILMSGKISPDPTKAYLGKDNAGKDIFVNIGFAGAPSDLVNLLKNINDYGIQEGFFKSIAAKEAPLIRTGTELLTNRNYLGQEIIPKGAGLVMGTARSAYELAAGLSPIPFSISNFFTMATDQTNKYIPAEYISILLGGGTASHVVPSGQRQVTSGKNKGKLVPASPNAPERPFWEQVTSGKKFEPKRK